MGKKRSRPTYQVFLSHATADKWLAEMICEKIEGVGATTFRDDRDIHGGDDIPEEIRRQIKQSREVVVLLTPESVNRPWVLLEIGAAWGTSRKRRITPIMCHTPISLVPDMIKNTKVIGINDMKAYLSELSRRVKEGR